MPWEEQGPKEECAPNSNSWLPERYCNDRKVDANEEPVEGLHHLPLRVEGVVGEEGLRPGEQEHQKDGKGSQLPAG